MLRSEIVSANLLVFFALTAAVLPPLECCYITDAHELGYSSIGMFIESGLWSISV
jgi:hypothetical protein